MCLRAGFSSYYTNHSGKVTYATQLFENNIDEQLIMRQTGHRSGAVRNYKRPGVQHDQLVSSVLQPLAKSVKREPLSECWMPPPQNFTLPQYTLHPPPQPVSQSVGWPPPQPVSQSQCWKPPPQPVSQSECWKPPPQPVSQKENRVYSTSTLETKGLCSHLRYTECCCVGIVLMLAFLYSHWCTKRLVYQTKRFCDCMNVSIIG